MIVLRKLKLCRIITNKQQIDNIGVLNYCTRSKYERRMQKPRPLNHKNDTINHIDWDNVRKNLLNHRNYTGNQLNDAVLGICKTSSDPLEASLSYVKYLKQQNDSAGDKSLRNKLLKFIKAQASKTPNLSFKVHESIVIKYCLDILHNPEETPSDETKDLILNIISVTSAWNEALAFINDNKITCTPSNLPAFSAIVANAFHENRVELAFQILKQILQAKLEPTCASIIAYFGYCERDLSNLNENLEKMFTFLEQHELVVSKVVLHRLKELLFANTLKFLWTDIDWNSRQCLSCKHQLKQSIDSTMCQLDFAKLKRNFEQTVFNKNLLEGFSSPSEMIRFKQYVNKKRTYDFIVDGLNVSLLADKGNILAQAKLLSAVLKELVYRRQRVLIIGRKHMEKWPQREMSYIQKHATLFLTENETDEDPYLLFAALNSGPEANILSRDHFKEYAEKLSPEVQTVFKQWQKEHQYSFSWDSKKEKARIKKQCPFAMHAHKVENHWHLPYSENSDFKTNQYGGKVISWACIKLVKHLSESS